jgi:arylsulfatase A-like enzyme
MIAMNVVVVMARGLRADFLGCYGNLWVDTPAFDTLAATGVLFDRHFGDSCDRHPITRDLLAALRAAGRRAWLVRDGRLIAPPESLAGWDKVLEADDGDAIDETLDLAEQALADLAAESGFLLMVELTTALPPWDVPDEYLEPYFSWQVEDDDEMDSDEDSLEPDEPLTDPELGPVEADDDELFLQLQSTYAAAVGCLDAAVGRLIDLIDRMGRREDTLLIVTADHGFPLGEHGVLGPDTAPPHEELFHVPLMLRLTGGERAGTRISALTQPADLGPTIADPFGVSISGTSLLPLVRGERDMMRPYVVSSAAGSWRLRTPEWVLVRSGEGEAGRAQLFVKPDDRWEVNDVAQHHLEWVAYLEGVLWAVRGGGRPELRAYSDVVEAAARSEAGDVP